MSVVVLAGTEEIIDRRCLAGHRLAGQKNTRGRLFVLFCCSGRDNTSAFYSVLVCLQQNNQLGRETSRQNNTLFAGLSGVYWLYVRLHRRYGRYLYWFPRAGTFSFFFFAANLGDNDQPRLIVLSLLFAICCASGIPIQQYVYSWLGGPSSQIHPISRFIPRNRGKQFQVVYFCLHVSEMVDQRLSGEPLFAWLDVACSAVRIVAFCTTALSVAVGGPV